MTLEEEVERDLRRSARWERVYSGWATFVAVIVALACGALNLYREWWIWNR